MKVRSTLKLVSAVIICQAAGIVGSIFTTPAIPGWYAGLQKPAFSPPNWIFGPVWIFLYFLTGISLYLIWSHAEENAEKKKERNLALWLFGTQLVLNSAWSIIFFGIKNPFYALIELAILLVVLAATIWRFWKINKNAAYLLLPYILWSTFAMVLNYSIWQLNF